SPALLTPHLDRPRHQTGGLNATTPARDCTPPGLSPYCPNRSPPPAVRPSGQSACRPRAPGSPGQDCPLRRLPQRLPGSSEILGYSMEKDGKGEPDTKHHATGDKRLQQDEPGIRRDALA